MMLLRTCTFGFALAFGTSVSTIPAQAQTPDVAREGKDGVHGSERVLTRRITLTLDGVSLKQAVDSVARVAQVIIQYQGPLLNGKHAPVTVHASNLPLGIVLERILDGTRLRAVPEGEGNLAIVTSADEERDSVADLGTLAGRVVDSATGRSLNGATVKVAGSKISAVTQDSGRFTLRNVPVGSQILTIRMFGYRPTERSIDVGSGANARLRIALATTPNVLAGVVTTAVGEQDRRTLGNDITVINADSVMQVAPVHSVTDLLESRVPGLTVTHSSGLPGAPSRIRIRGVTGGLIPGATNQSNDPIVIVDGMRVYAQSSTLRDQNGATKGRYTAPSPIDQIDPNSIEKVEVFKGPSASSQYGPDAANGVIVITTKRGKAGPLQASVALESGREYLPGHYAHPGFYPFGHDVMAPEAEFNCGGLTGDTRRDDPDAFGCLIDTVLEFQALNIPRLSTFGHGTRTGASATLSGGSSTFDYAITGSANRTIGLLVMPSFYQDTYHHLYDAPVPGWMKRPDLYKTWNGQGTFTSHMIPGLQLQYMTSLGNSDQRQSSAQAQVSVLAGSYIDTTVYDGSGLGNYAQRITSHSLTANNAVSASWNRWPRLPLRAQAGLNTVDRQDESLIPHGVYTGGGPPDLSNSDLTGGSYAYARQTTQLWSGDLSGTLFPNGRVATGFGFNVTNQTTRDFTGANSRLSGGISIPSTFTIASQQTSGLVTGGWFLEPRFNFGNRFFAAPGFRLDNRSGSVPSESGLSQLITRPQVLFTHPASLFRGGLSALLPKIDVSWVALNREGETPFLGAITLLRPRVAYGVSGIQPDPTWLLRNYRSAGASVDTLGRPLDPYPGVYLAAIGNPILRPERKREFEAGAEVQLWGNRLVLNGSGFVQLRYDAIETVPTAPSAGGISLLQYRNIGQVRNTGVELTVDATPLQSAAVAWSVHSSLSMNRTTLLTLNGSQSAVDMGNGIRLVPGYPLNGRWDRPIVGYTIPTNGQPVGLGDLVIGDSVHYLGTATPGYTLPVSSALSVLGGALRFNTEFQYEHGLTQFGSGNFTLLTNLYLDPSATPGQQAAALAAACVRNSNFLTGGCVGRGTTAGLVQTVNVLRWRSVTAAYTIPPQMTRRLRLPRTIVAIEGTNVGLWTSYRGKDPDVNGTPVGEAIEDNGQIPEPRSWGIRFTLGS